MSGAELGKPRVKSVMRDPVEVREEELHGQRVKINIYPPVRFSCNMWDTFTVQPRGEVRRALLGEGL